MLSDFVKYVKQYWHDRPDKSTPLNADRLNHIENGIGSNSEAINQIANAVVSNIVNDPDKIASMAAVYTLQEKLGTGDLPSDAPNAISAINTLYSNLEQKLLYTTDLLPVQAVFGREVVSTTGKTGSIDLSKYIPAGRTLYSFCIVSSEGSHPLYSIVQDNKLVVNMVDSTASTTFVVNFMVFVH